MWILAAFCAIVLAVQALAIYAGPHSEHDETDASCLMSGATFFAFLAGALST